MPCLLLGAVWKCRSYRDLCKCVVDHSIHPGQPASSATWEPSAFLMWMPASFIFLSSHPLPPTLPLLFSCCVHMQVCGMEYTCTRRPGVSLGCCSSGAIHLVCLNSLLLGPGACWIGCTDLDCEPETHQFLPPQRWDYKHMPPLWLEGHTRGLALQAFQWLSYPPSHIGFSEGLKLGIREGPINRPLRVGDGFMKPHLP